MELFVLKMEQVTVLQNNVVKEFIATSYTEPQSLQALTARFGLNEFKLKKGYRHFFQATVFWDILRLRMQHARKLLAERVMNVTEVAYHVGYNNLSSFSFAFKKAFIARSVIV